MQRTVYVFINEKGWFFGDRESAGLGLGEPNPCFYKPFQQARIFSSVRAAVKYRSGVINTDITINMMLMPITITYSKQDIFKTILKRE